VRDLGALGVLLTLGVGAAVLGYVVVGVVGTLGVGVGVLGCGGTLGVGDVTLGAVTVSVTGACTLGTARLVAASSGVCGVTGANISQSWASMALVGSPLCRNGSAGRGLLLTTWAISSKAAARRSLDDVWDMRTFVGRNSTVLETRSPRVAVTKIE
jgi:hypothetical protein